MGICIGSLVRLVILRDLFFVKVERRIRLGDTSAANFCRSAEHKLLLPRASAAGARVIARFVAELATGVANLARAGGELTVRRLFQDVLLAVANVMMRYVVGIVGALFVED